MYNRLRFKTPSSKTTATFLILSVFYNSKAVSSSTQWSNKLY